MSVVWGVRVRGGVLRWRVGRRWKGGGGRRVGGVGGR